MPVSPGEIYNDHVKLTFKGASLKDPDRLLTQNGTVRRAIDFNEESEINEPTFRKLVQEAVELNFLAKEKR